ncbi:MAG: response regulator, partial [Pseudomonadota bacterium]
MAQPAHKSLLFLVVDDQFNVRRMVQNFLRTFGYNKTIDASDGLKAWEKLDAHEVGFVICDWNMPNLNGLGLLRRVRADQRLRDLPFLMVTAEMAEDIVAEAIEEGVDGYIVKPFQAKTLVDKVEAILEKRGAPDPVEVHLRQGADLLAQGLADQALSEFESALALSPQSPRSLVACGEALEAQGRDQEALQRYHQAIKLAPRYVRARDRLGKLLARLGQHDLATQQLEAAAAISPRNARRQMEVGRLLLEQGQTDKALVAIRAASERGSDDAALAEEMGEMLLSAGLNEEAARSFSRAVRLDPAKVHVFNRLGIAYRRQGRFKEAVREYQRA